MRRDFTEPVRLLRFLWILSFAWFLVTWVAGFTWLGIGWVLEAWSYWSLPLFLLTAVGGFGRGAVREVRAAWLPLLVWVSLLALGHLDPETVGGAGSLAFRAGSLLLAVIGTVFPPLLILHGWRLSLRLRAHLGAYLRRIIMAGAMVAVTLLAVKLYGDFQPNYRADVYIRAGVSESQVQTIWTGVLSKPSRTGTGTELHVGLRSVSRNRREGQEMIVLEFSPSSTKGERAMLIRRLRASPFVQRVEEPSRR